MGKMEKFYEGWVCMSANPIGSPETKLDIKYFNHGNKDAQLAVRDFVHKHLCNGNAVTTVPCEQPSSDLLRMAHNFKEPINPCRVTVKFTWEHHHGAILIKNPAAKQSVLLQGDDSIFFMDEVQRISESANDEQEYEQMEQELLSQYAEVMQDDE